MIAVALLLPILEIPSQSEVGPFVIETVSFREEGYPRAGFAREVTELRWKSPSGLTVYSLTDDGESVLLSFRIGGDGGWCQSGSDPVRLTERPSVKFYLECKILGEARAKLLATEMRAARPYFAAAYASFYKVTLRQHGPDLRRCRQRTTGNHGWDCVRFWDEGSTATDQPKNKRNR